MVQVHDADVTLRFWRRGGVSPAAMAVQRREAAVPAAQIPATAAARTPPPSPSPPRTAAAGAESSISRRPPDDFPRCPPHAPELGVEETPDAGETRAPPVVEATEAAWLFREKLRINSSSELGSESRTCGRDIVDDPDGFHFNFTSFPD